MVSLALTVALALGGCDPEANARSFTPEEKAETRAEVQAACRAAGAAPIICAYWDAVVWRESWGGVATAVCTLGADRDGTLEYGLGPMCLSKRWHSDKWLGDAEDFCDPTVSFAVANEIAWRAVTRWNAGNILGIQAIFGQGAGACGPLPPASWATSSWAVVRWLNRWLRRHRQCRPPTARNVNQMCARMSKRGFSCRTPITEADLGRRVRLTERRAWVESVATASGPV